MDDHTRDGEMGAGPGPDVPLKRDRKRLRSSKAVPPRPQPVAPAPLVTEPREATPTEPELREPGLSPAERLFAGQWAPTPAATAPVTTAPAAAAPAGTAPDISQQVDARVGKAPLRTEVVDGPVAAAARTPRYEDAPTTPYVPPGGFTEPGHPRLGPLAPVPPAAHPGLRTLDIAAFVSAIVLPPVGLVAAVVAIIRGKKIRGWASDLARAAVSLSLAMTVVFAIVGGSVWFTEVERAEQLAAVKAEQRAHDRIEAVSAPFCGVLAEHPTIYAEADPDYGWPAVDAPGGYNAAIAEYSAVWNQIAEVAPPGIAEETAALSGRIAEIVEISQALGASNRAGDLLGLREKDDLATVESWYVEYCDAPEIPAE